MQVSFVELRRSRIRDLLTDDDNSVRLRECPANGPYVENVTCALRSQAAVPMPRCTRAHRLVSLAADGRRNSAAKSAVLQLTIVGATRRELRVSDADEVMQALAAGVGRRTTLKGPQGQRRSSRCHMVFTVNLMQRRLAADGRSASSGPCLEL